MTPSINKIELLKCSVVAVGGGAELLFVHHVDKSGNQSNISLSRQKPLILDLSIECYGEYHGNRKMAI